MGWLELAGLVFQLILKIWDAIHERNAELKKEKTDALKQGLDAVTSQDPAAVIRAFDRINRLR